MLWLISSCAGGGYRERRITTEECEEITDRNTIARRLGYSDFEANDSFRDDFCFDREYSRSARPRTEDGGKPFIYPRFPFELLFPLYFVGQIFIYSDLIELIQFYEIVIFLDFTCALIFWRKKWRYFPVKIFYLTFQI